MKKRRTHWTDPAQQTVAVQWLGRDQHTSRLLGTAQRLVALQQAMTAGLPATLRPACQAMKLDEGLLTIGVRSASMFAKLRQCAPSLARHLSECGWQVDRIQVRVQSEQLLAQYQPEAPAHQPALIGESGLAAFEALAASLPEGKMAEAVQRLLARRRPPTPD